MQPDLVAGKVDSSSSAQAAALRQMAAGGWVAQALYVAAKLGVADLLAEGARRPDEIAAAAGQTPMRFIAFSGFSLASGSSWKMNSVDLASRRLPDLCAVTRRLPWAHLSLCSMRPTLASLGTVASHSANRRIGLRPRLW